MLGNQHFLGFTCKNWLRCCQEWSLQSRRRSRPASSPGRLGPVRAFTGREFHQRGPVIPQMFIILVWHTAIFLKVRYSFHVRHCHSYYYTIALFEISGILLQDLVWKDSKRAGFQNNGNNTRYALPRLQTTSSHHFLTRWKLQKRLETSIIQDLEISRAPTFLNKFA